MDGFICDTLQNCSCVLPPTCTTAEVNAERRATWRRVWTDRRTDRHSWGQARLHRGGDERRDTQWNDGNPLTRHCLVTISQRAAGTNIRLPASMRAVNRLPALFTFLILSLSTFMIVTAGQHDCQSTAFTSPTTTEWLKGFYTDLTSQFHKRRESQDTDYRKEYSKLKLV